MKRLKFNKRAMFLIYILGWLLFVPIAINIDPNSQITSQTEQLSIDSELVSELSSVLSQNDVNRQNFEYQASSSLFSPQLSQILSNETHVNKNGLTKVKIIVLFEEYLDKSDRLLLLESFLDEYTLLANYEIIPGIYLKVNSKDLIKVFQSVDEIKGIKKIYLSETFNSPYINTDIPESSSLDSVDYPNWWIPAIHADDLPYDGTGVRVAVVDTGIFNHSDYDVILSRNFVSGESPTNIADTYGHGTHVAGIIGGDGLASSGIYRGVAPGVSLINARAGNYSGLEEGDIINAIEWCVMPEISGGAEADIISMSFGGGYPEADDPMTLAISSAANDYGAILVSSAGNSGPGYFTGGSPAAGVDVISVGAINSQYKLASFSSWGPSLSYIGYPDVIAPGVNIFATESPESVISEEKRYVGDVIDYSGDFDYIPLSGTSMACPFVSGALAILKDAFPNMTPETGKIAIMKGANKNLNESYEYLKHGAGIVNLSASIEYLMDINATYGDVNEIAAIYPDIIPVKPYDLLNFPGDEQAFNLTLISGKGQTIDIDIPDNINGLKLTLDKDQVIFSNEDTSFVTLAIQIENNAIPGEKSFSINVSSGGHLYETIDISIEVKIPEYKILMESYHGLNDWYPELSFYQMGFYDAMKTIIDLNISIDYYAEYWTPNYDINSDNSILTEERLFQYDLIILQNPILPYSLLEIKNLKDYFESGGNLLFLGTRHNDLCIANINTLFTELDLNLEINQETVIDENWLGLGASYQEITVTDFNSTEIFDGVNGFTWAYGNTFSLSGDTHVIAAIDGKYIASAYDGRDSGKGRFAAFGDLHWLYTDYNHPTTNGDHEKLLTNLMRYFLNEDDISLNIDLKSERTSTSQVNISINVFDQLSNSPISSSLLESRLNVSITNVGYQEDISMTSFYDGNAINTSFTLPWTSYIPYDINVNITIGGTTYYKTSKVLYYDPSDVPNINSLTITSSVSRIGNQDIDIDAQLDAITYEATTFMTIYTSSYYNTKQTTNHTLTMNYLASKYSSTYIPNSNDPSGYVLAYIIPENPISNYINPNSKRVITRIINNPPEFDELKSTFIVNGQTYTLDETHDEESTYVITATQGDRFDFNITVSDSVPYEDPDSSNMKVSVNLLTVSTTEDNYIMLILPSAFPLVELGYSFTQDTHVGSFSIPSRMQYSTIRGIKYISTVSNYDFNAGDGYLSILLITVFDSEGASEDFVLVLSIQEALEIDLMILTLIIGMVAAIGIALIIYVIRRRKKRSGAYKAQEWNYYQSSNSIPDSQQVIEESSQKTFAYCPYCGNPIRNETKYCSNCGRSIEFTTND